MDDYEYRVVYQRAGDRPRTWASSGTLERARAHLETARKEDRWGEIWIERKPITEWERLP